MNILLVFPEFPDTFWGLKYALRFISKKSYLPPLGLITVSAMLPKTWQKKLVDMNVSTLRTSDIQWADYVLISAMYVQKESVSRILEECTKMKVKIIAGGPLFIQEFNDYPQIDHLILNEAEITLPLFLKDLETGQPPKKIYKTDEYADITVTPVPDYHLLSMKDYASMNIQVSRGCPFLCDFCEITTLLGHKVRIKDAHQVLEELELLYNLNWRGRIVFVDDNFIGNKNVVKNTLLPSIIQWMQRHNYPFTFDTQSSINLADDEKLISMMVEAGFTSAFIGIETPEEKSLQDCNKGQNKNRDMLEDVKKLQNAGLVVSGGFIVGFDSDTPTVFQRQIDFIQQSGIVSALVGLLIAPKNTKLYKRLKSENRLTNEPSGNSNEFSLNFIPKMNTSELINGYRKIIYNIYSTKPYYTRIRKLLMNYHPSYKNPVKIDFSALRTLFKALIIIGILNNGRRDFWKLLIWTIRRHPVLLADVIKFSIYGYHFRKVFGISV